MIMEQRSVNTNSMKIGVGLENQPGVVPESSDTRR